MKKKALLIYHYGLPDDVVSASHLHGIGKHLATTKFDVDFLCSNAFCRTEGTHLKHRECIDGVNYRRYWGLNTSSHVAKKLINGIKSKGFIMDQKSSIDIDTEEDLQLARLLHQLSEN